jgi:glutathione S-transferase
VRAALQDRLFHLAIDVDWIAALQSDGCYRASTVGRSLDDEGFVHCSFASQLQATADRFYAGRRDVLLLAIDPLRLDVPVRVEPAPGTGERYPHVYGPIPVDAVVWAQPVPLGPSGLLDLESLLRP